MVQKVRHLRIAPPGGLEPPTNGLGSRWSAVNETHLRRVKENILLRAENGALRRMLAEAKRKGGT